MNLLQNSLSISSVFVGNNHQPQYKVFKRHLNTMNQTFYLLNMKTTSALIWFSIKCTLVLIKRPYCKNSK